MVPLIEVTQLYRAAPETPGQLLAKVREKPGQPAGFPDAHH